MTEQRTVYIGKNHWRDARQVHGLLRLQARTFEFAFHQPRYTTLSQYLNCPLNEIRTLLEGVACDTCGASLGQQCSTRSARPARHPHAAREVELLAVIFAVRAETTITEEPDIEDLIS